MSEEGVHVTDHAAQRMKERLGLPKSAIQKQADVAFAKGLHHSDARGKARRYIDGLFLTNRTANNIRVHAGYAYLFAGRSLLTVMSFPKELLAGMKP